MPAPRKILVFHTAFPGDIILATPLLETLRAHFPEARVTVVAVPSAAGVLAHHRAVDDLVPYDKKGREKGLRGFLHLVKRLRSGGFELAIIPHRSLRSASAAWLAHVPRRIGFSTSAGRWLLTDAVPYVRDVHETARNIHLLEPLNIRVSGVTLPTLYPGEDDRSVVRAIIDAGVREAHLDPLNLVAVAPGSRWETKRWPEARFAELVRMLLKEGHSVVLIGGKEDNPACVRMLEGTGKDRVLNTAGRLSFLQSAELLRRCRVLISNDSAPMHLAAAMRTPVVAVFGATIPGFGFGPQGKEDVVVETPGLSCRPCSIHGGYRCPIGTFECMVAITPDRIIAAVRTVLSRRKGVMNAPDA